MKRPTFYASSARGYNYVVTHHPDQNAILDLEHGLVYTALGFVKVVRGPVLENYTYTVKGRTFRWTFKGRAKDWNAVARRARRLLKNLAAGKYDKRGAR